MTLSSFKRKSKLSAVLIFLISYAVVFFTLGNLFSYSKNINFGQFLKVKGVSTKSKFAQPVNSPMPYADTQSNSVVPSYVKLCSNTKYSYQVSYPNDWFTTYNTDDQKCSFFAPYSFTVPQSTDGFSPPIKIEAVPISEWEGTVKFYENPNDFQNVISIQNIEINGNAVTKIKAQTTGTDSSAKGQTKLTFLYFNSQVPLVFTYQQDPKDNIANGETLLEDMVRSLQYF